MHKGDNFTFLTSAPIGKVILTMSVPTIISMLTTSLYNMVDTYYVGRISTQAVAAVGIAFPIMAVFQAVGFYFGQGSGTFISRALGARKAKEARQMASTSFYCSFAFGVILGILGLVFLDPLVKALGSTPTVLPYARKFIGILLLGTPFVTSQMTLNNQMRFQGNASYAMVGVLSGAILNVVLVPIFAFVLKMGIRGAAIGTVLGEVASFCVLVAMTFKKDTLGINPRDFSFRSSLQKDILKGGSPSFTRQALGSISTLLLNIAAAKYGDAAIAGMSIVGRISFMIYAVILGLGQGYQPLCGFCYGAGLYERIRKGYWFGLKACFAFLAIVFLFGLGFSEEVISFIRKDPDVVKVGAIALRWQIVALPLAAVVTFSNMTLQTCGWSVPATVLSAARNGIFFIPLILILPVFTGLTGVEISQPIADVLSFFMAVPMIRKYFRTIGGKDNENP